MKVALEISGRTSDEEEGRGVEGVGDEAPVRPPGGEVALRVREAEEVCTGQHKPGKNGDITDSLR